MKNRESSNEESIDRSFLEKELKKYRSVVNKVCTALLKNKPELSSYQQDIFNDGSEIVLELMLDGNIDDDKFEKILANELQNRARRYVKEESFPSEFFDNIQDESPDIIDLIESKMMTEALLTSISNLPKTQKMAIILYYYCGLTQADAASRIGIKQAGLSRRLDRAKKKIYDDLVKMGFSQK